MNTIYPNNLRCAATSAVCSSYLGSPTFKTKTEQKIKQKQQQQQI